LIKEVIRFGGDISGLVPAFVRDRLEEKLSPGRE
jgi:phosphopantetheine adenylyltransferase